MGWSGPFMLPDGRLGGYAVPTFCDKNGCDAKIDRGLAYVCGDMHGGGEHSCGRYFCYEHLCIAPGDEVEQLCDECLERYEKERPDCWDEDEDE